MPPPKNRSDVDNPVASQVQQLEPQTLCSAACGTGRSVFFCLYHSECNGSGWKGRQKSAFFCWMLEKKKKKKREKLNSIWMETQLVSSSSFMISRLETMRGDREFCSSEDQKRAGDAAEEFTAEPDRWTSGHAQVARHALKLPQSRVFWDQVWRPLDNQRGALKWKAQVWCLH